MVGSVLSGNAEIMPQAITRCPSCGTSFRITENQLFAAEGSVRCGACLLVFQAEDYFISPMLDVTELLAIEEEYWSDFERYVYQVAGSHLSPSDDETTGETETIAPDPTVEPVIAYEISGQELEASVAVDFWDPSERMLPSGEELPGDVVGYWQPAPRHVFLQITEPVEKPEISASNVVQITEPAEKPEISASSVVQVWEPEVSAVAFWEPVNEAESESYWDEELPSDIPALELDIEHDPDSLLVDRRRIVSFAGLKWLPGIAAMVIIGFLQYAYFNITTYAQDLQYRDYYVRVCSYLGCEVPDYVNLDELRTRELLVRSHPIEEQALVADVLLLNAAAYRQAFPQLRLRFFDINGDVVAGRTFRVGE
ncbi:MAG: DUF3426 domain-containing protein, partial [Gammaproteobacteria bacterium]|nr:DUF3426 domain-containing protein [Gammaproteobacteria bacterium]